MAVPTQTTPGAQDPSAPADPIALAAFVSRRGGRVLAYLDAVTTPERALTAAGEAFAAFRVARAADPDAEAAATTLLRATRRAATAHAENPYRPDGRERPSHRIAACDAMPRLLVAWTEARLPDRDVERLVEHLQDCPDCRALRDAFDRAELGYRGGEAVPLDGTEVGVVATAMALAVAPPPAPAAPETAAPATARVPERRRRTSLPAPRSPRTDDPTRTAADSTRRPAGTPVGRRTAIPAPPTAGPLPAERPAGRRTALPGRPTALPSRPATEPEDVSVTPASPVETTSPATAPPAETTSQSTARPAETTSRSTGTTARTTSPVEPSKPDAKQSSESSATGPTARERSMGPSASPADPLGPEALGYAVPRAGLPAPKRRPAVPRARRRRPRRTPSAAIAEPAASETEDAPTTAASASSATSRADAAAPTVARQVRITQDEPADASAAPSERTPDVSDAKPGPSAAASVAVPTPAETDPKTATPTAANAVDDDATPATPADTDATPADEEADREAPRSPMPTPTAGTMVPATVADSGVASVGRRVLEIPIVRQLGVPAVLLLAVLIAALIAAGAFAGKQEETVAPVTRPTIPTVPADPSQIPPLR